MYTNGRCWCWVTRSLEAGCDYGVARHLVVGNELGRYGFSFVNYYDVV